MENIQEQVFLFRSPLSRDARKKSNKTKMNKNTLYFHCINVPYKNTSNRERVKRRYQLQNGIAKYRRNAFAYEYKFPAAFYTSQEQVDALIRPHRLELKAGKQIKSLTDTSSLHNTHQMNLMYILN
mmetsp:Transcript_24312/g.27019  ORF Transcript_24312/g.27019 Transcript_24312/m.27019 type:complete len:126 (+) Transcript_24312:81-458(+)